MKKINDNKTSDTENVTNNVYIVSKRYKNIKKRQQLHIQLQEKTFFQSADAWKNKKTLKIPRKPLRIHTFQKKIVKENSNLFTHFISKGYTDMLSEFPQTSKNLYVNLVYKKDSRNNETNYKSVVILLYLSKVSKNCISDEIVE